MTIFNDSTDEDTNTDNIIEDEDLDTPFTFSEIKHKTIIDNQFGLQKENSTVDCIFILQSFISKTLAEKKKTLRCLFRLGTNVR